eukprot:TRINITY_DN15886_c0_g1_i1.p1 TRINITY_DN15886_c0_g1~~TRINITY_DN15886_c0_g1_i1.p1  ORF type:complete len:296 (-),score=26.58 TRINITY_DN15886_c0_g1_i1:476-1363(-)
MRQMITAGLVLVTMTLMVTGQTWGVNFNNNNGGCGSAGACTTYTVGSEGSFPPYANADPASITGLSVDILNAAATAGGCHLNWVKIPWGACIRDEFPIENAANFPDGSNVEEDGVRWYAGSAMQSGFVSGCASAGITPERKTLFDFSMPYSRFLPSVIAVRSDSSITATTEITSITWSASSFVNSDFLDDFDPDLSGIATQEATANPVQEVLDGNFEAVLIPRNQAGDLREIASIPSDTLLGLMTRKDCTGAALLKCINAGIATIAANGEWARLCEIVRAANEDTPSEPDCTPLS